MQNTRKSPLATGPLALIALAVVLLIAFFALGSSLGATGSWVAVIALVVVLAAAAWMTTSGSGRRLGS